MWEFCFDLCRALGVIHPDHLAELLTARQLLDWYERYCDRPWGDEREDLRACAVLGAGAGIREVTPIWPYLRERSLDELAAEAGILDQLQAARRSAGTE